MGSVLAKFPKPFRLLLARTCRLFIRLSDDRWFFFIFVLVVFFVLLIIVIRVFRRQTFR